MDGVLDVLMILESTLCSPVDPPGVESPDAGIEIVPFVTWSLIPTGAELLNVPSVPPIMGEAAKPGAGPTLRGPIPAPNSVPPIPAVDPPEPVDPFKSANAPGAIHTPLGPVTSPGPHAAPVVLTGVPVVLIGVPVVLTGEVVVLTGEVVVLTGEVVVVVLTGELTVEPSPPPDDGPIPSLRFPSAICCA
jgi:hypothetical protein